MSTLLRLYLPADWPTRQTACEWELVNAAGARLQLGSSEPRHWPPADGCELILSAEQCLLVRLPLPKGARARTPEVVGYALEERLLGDAEAEYFVVGDASDKSAATPSTPVWVIARARLQALLAVLRPLARMPQRLVCELQLAPLPADGGWSVCLKTAPGGGFVRQAAEAGFSFDFDPAQPAVPPLELQLAVQLARQAEQAPPAIEVHAAAGTAFDGAAAQAWQQALGIPVRLAGEYAWRDYPSGAARNLLGGEFAPPRSPREGWGSLRPALLLGAATLALYSAFSFGEWAWLDHQKSAMRQQMTDRFRSAFPQVQAIVDPALQMQRLHDQLRRERGQLGSTDFLPLLAAASEASNGQGQLRSLSFEDGRLEMTIVMANAAAVERLRETLTRRGLTAVVRDSHPAGGGVEAVFAVRGNS